jgi:hypothetical protein
MLLCFHWDCVLKKEQQAAHFSTVTAPAFKNSGNHTNLCFLLLVENNYLKR